MPVLACVTRCLGVSGAIAMSLALSGGAVLKKYRAWAPVPFDGFDLPIHVRI